MDDLISRQAAIEAVKKTQEPYVPSLSNDVFWCVKALSELQPAQTEQKTGQWIDVPTEIWCTFDECKCSVCGAVEYFNKGWKKFSYCPNCGAKMVGDAE